MDDLAREQHLSNAVEEVHRVVIVKVIDDIRQPLVVHPPLGLRPLAKTLINLLRRSSSPPSLRAVKRVQRVITTSDRGLGPHRRNSIVQRTDCGSNPAKLSNSDKKSVYST